MGTVEVASTAMRRMTALAVVASVVRHRLQKPSARRLVET
jgi:hypothetical protein